MRAKDFLFEDDGKPTRAKSHEGFNQNIADEMPDAEIYPAIQGNYYDMYRFQLAMAGSPDWQHDFYKKSPAANGMLTLIYSDAEKQIVDKAKKFMGVSGKVVSRQGSHERPDVNKTSPFPQNSGKGILRK